MNASVVIHESLSTAEGKIMHFKYHHSFFHPFLLPLFLTRPSFVTIWLMPVYTFIFIFSKLNKKSPNFPVTK